MPHAPGSGAFDPLRTLAESFADAQDVRIRIENRLRSGTVPQDVASEVLAAQREVEKKLGQAMRKAFRLAAPDLHAWVKDTVGIGEHLMARLLGAIGHPVLATPHHWEGEGEDRILVADPPFERNVAKLWAYCGVGDPSRKRRKGMTADEAVALGQPRAKMLVRLLAEACIKQIGTPPTQDAPISEAPASGTTVGTDPDQLARNAHTSIVRRRSPYRDVYEARRLATSDRDWTDGHRHADALRIVGKEILRDLWLAARRTKSDPASKEPASGGFDPSSDSQVSSESQSAGAIAGDSRGTDHEVTDTQDWGVGVPDSEGEAA